VVAKWRVHGEVAGLRGVSPFRGTRGMIPRASQTVMRLQDRLAGLLGTTVEGRSGLVSAMLERNPNEATSYWLQLVVSAGIATLGLVVGSTAVVIGAMLVAPLMGPIIGLAMGLASGSPFLVLRSVGRIVLSVLVAIGGAATITFLLPFHEINAEIASRTSPTVLDLITAGFCALAGVYASLRPGSETATTAAGTSISISLVPPLCASGYGFGTLNSTIAAGASLLFLTNLVAIVVVGTLTFVASGFNQGDIQFVATVSQALATSLSVPQMRVCVARPEVEAEKPRAAREPLGNEASMTVTELLLAHPRVDFSAGEGCAFSSFSALARQARNPSRCLPLPLPRTHRSLDASAQSCPVSSTTTSSSWHARR
jgi:uncharacterized hydrophobic protein (TIGR00271 family)